MATILGIETSCDETAVAVLQDGLVRANQVSSQVKIHAEYGGVVPELASREHLRNLLPLTRLALDQAGVPPDQIDMVAATRGPGLPGALMIGWRYAQAFAYARQIPCLAVHHHEGHLYSPWLVGEPQPRLNLEAFEPNIALIVSGGHTLLVDVPAPLEHTVLGETLDDAAGECFDKTAKLLGLPYPGGPAMERLAREGDPHAFPFPRPMKDSDDFHFSFSGLKTSVRYFLRDHPELLKDRQRVCDLCASIQAAIVEVLVTKTIRAARRRRRRCITVSGGVARNGALRQQLIAAAQKFGLQVRIAQPEFCTDNAAMIAAVAEIKRRQDRLPPPSWHLDVAPNWHLTHAHQPHEPSPRP